MNIKKICVFCGSSLGRKTEYAEQAALLGEHLADSSIELIYGGGDVGLMGIISRSVMNKGGRVTGIIPEKLNEKVSHSNISEIRVVKDMHQRKAMMYDLADAFICLPGGIGSLEELLESFTWLQLGYHSKPVCVVNTGNYYSHLLNQLDIMVSEGFMKESHRANLIITEKIDNIVETLSSMTIISTDKWDVQSGKTDS